jgi:mannose-6-phosphate isomerase
MRPVELGPNQPRQFYRGGAAIAAFRGTAVADEFRPEDWVASATARYGTEDDGLSRLPDGTLLRDAIAADPEAWLGPEHAAYFGASPALLVKLLDAGERLPVHAHPTRAFALRHLGSRHGKTEAWVVLSTRGAEPVVYLGWSRDVEAQEVTKWVASQDSLAMLSNLHRLPVASGDAVLVPAGTPHAIGEGVFCLELQEPTDFSVMLEFASFGLNPSEGELGLGRELALSCVSRLALSEGRLAELLRRRATSQAPATTPVGPTITHLLPSGAEPYFRAERATPGAGNLSLSPSFAVLVVLAGAGQLTGASWEVHLKAGTTWVVPWGAGASALRGEVELVRCLPPLPAEAAAEEPAGAT